MSGVPPISPAVRDATPHAPEGDGGPTGVHITRGAFAMLSAQPFTWAASLASVALVPKYLGDEGLGKMSVAWIIGTFVATLATLGLPTFLARKVASQPERAPTYAWASLAIIILAALPISLVLFAVMGVTGGRSVDPVLLSFGMTTALVLAIQSVLLAVLVGLGRNARYAWSLAAAFIFSTSAGLGTLLLGGDAYGYSAAMCASWTISTLILWRTSGLHFTRAALAPAVLRELAVGGTPFLGWVIAQKVRAEIDVVLVAILLQANVAGWLAAAYRIINITVFIPTAITIPLLPALTRSKERPEAFRSLLSDSLASVLLLTIPVSASIFALAPFIPSSLGWPEPLQHAVPLMQILAFQQTLVGVDMVLSASLVALGLERRWLWVAAAAAMFNPALNIVAIPLAHGLTGNGAIGAGIVELATECVFFSGAMYLTPRGLLGRRDLGRATRTVAAGAGMVAVATMVQPFGPVVVLSAGAATYVAIGFALGVIRPRQLRAMRLALRAA